MSNEQVLPDDSRPNQFDLEPHERLLIELLAAGYTSEESTERLRISEQDLNKILATIFGKLEVANRLELVLFATYHRIIDSIHAPTPYP